jgi:hypothetical protein
MDALEQYLNAATRWLFGKRKHQVRTELKGNIQERLLEFQLGGYSPDEGLAAALHEFGSAKKISLQLLEVHTMPFVYKSSVAIGAVFGAVILAVTSSAAPLAVTNLAPLPECSTTPIESLNSVIRCAFPGTWVRYSQLKQELESQGGAALLENQTLRLRFAGDAKEIQFQIKNPEVLVLPGGYPEVQYHSFISFEKDGDTFISIALTVSQIAKQSGLAMRLRGWQNPVLQVGQTELTLGTAENTYLGVFLYTQGLGQALHQILPDRGTNTPNGRLPSLTYLDTQKESRASYLYEQHEIELDSENGVYAVVLQDPKDGRFLYTIGKAENRSLTTYLPSQKIVFVKSFEQILGQATLLEQNVIILRLTGNLNRDTFQIISPKTPSSTRIAR